MNNALLFVLSLIGLLALYWVLIGQWRWNKMLMEKEDAKGKEEQNKGNSI